MAEKKKKKYATGLSTTTMVDVLFILLIFFVLISTIKKDTIQVKATKINKNKKSKSLLKKKKEEHVISIDKNNNIYLDGKKIKKINLLKNLLKRIKRKVPKDTIPIIILRPDAFSKSSTLIEIFGILNEVGLTNNVQIEVEAEKK